tara:strand:+ start:437 stop:556 length:120 start_codon:yes stop_codon:yes gene_type:complete
MITANTTKTRDGSNFRKVIAIGIAAKLSILAIFLVSKLG